ncbi:MAG: response regulator [Chlorobiota bacterium]
MSSLIRDKKYKIAVVDDEPDILELVSIHLKKNNYDFVTFENANDFLEYLNNNEIDLLILDLMLPDLDGFEVCKHLKSSDKFSSIPVIMLTARSDEMEKVLGLELGADDYVTKPFSSRELMARVKVILKRNKKVETKSEYITIGDGLKIDLNKYEVLVDDNELSLTSSEFKILELISSKKGWVYSREQILNYLGVIEKGVLDRTVDVHIKNLREKLGTYGKYIKNIRGVGYKIDES